MVKKIALVGIAVVGGLALSRRVAARRAEQQLWTEATDPVTTR